MGWVADRPLTPSSSHVLVVGGTGMLAGAVRALRARGHDVSVVARGSTRLERLAREQAPGTLHPLPVDYHDSSALRSALLQAQRLRGAVGLAICWIHGTAPDAPFVVAECVGRAATRERPARLFHLIGSASHDPLRPDPEAMAKFASMPGIAYRRVVLGFLVDGGRSRWLTDEEISTGVLAAIDGDAEQYVVGLVDPWDARP